MRTLLVAVLLVLSASARGDDALPSPLGLRHVTAVARAQRSEVTAARARARAAAQRVAVVSALDDPTITASIDHLPFDLMGFDRSITLEQAIPLSRVRGNRRRAAEADVRRVLANVDGAALDVELDTARAFWMLAEARGNAAIAEQQVGVAKQLAAAALARYTASIGPQADVLRADIEVARLAAEKRASLADVRAAEVMFNTSLARDVDAAIPPLDDSLPDDVPAPHAVTRAAAARPELRAGRAEIERAEAEVRVMRSMYAPMAMIRTGPAYTMAEGYGWMVMIGVSVPLWRGKLRAGVDEARAMVEMARAERDAMQRMVDGEARAARELMIAARERHLALRDEIVPRAEQAIAPTLAAYSAGQVPLVSVVEAAQALWGARRDLVMARAELGMAWARLRRATGEEMGK